MVNVMKSYVLSDLWDHTKKKWRDASKPKLWTEPWMWSSAGHTSVKAVVLKGWSQDHHHLEICWKDQTKVIQMSFECQGHSKKLNQKLWSSVLGSLLLLLLLFYVILTSPLDGPKVF